jgi:hypothetical protein
MRSSRQKDSTAGKSARAGSDCFELDKLRPTRESGNLRSSQRPNHGLSGKRVKSIMPNSVSNTKKRREHGRRNLAAVVEVPRLPGRHIESYPS